MKELKHKQIEELLDMENSNIRNLHNSWDKGDCSLIGLIRILMIQEIQKEKITRGVQYDGQYDDFLESIINTYNT